MSAEEIAPDANAPSAGGGLNMVELLPDFFERYFAFFRPGHTEGVAPSRVKELARLTIANLNGCDT